MKKEAAIDNDFMNHLAETKLDDSSKLNNEVKRLFEGMEVLPIIHELVYVHEFNDVSNSELNRRIGQSFIAEGIMGIKKKEDIIKSEIEAQYYYTVFEEVYKDFKGQLPVKNIWEDWKKSASLGETHTVTMCALIKCGIFLSDDSDSNILKSIIKNRFNFSIEVYNRSDAVSIVKEKGIVEMNRNVRKALAHKRC